MRLGESCLEVGLRCIHRIDSDGILEWGPFPPVSGISSI